MARRPTITETRLLLHLLEEAKENLGQYLEPEDENCAVPAHHREASANYLSAWVEGPIVRVADKLRKILGE
jgi:hypothetical protein